MVNRHARDIASDAIREFMNGSISNKEDERRFQRSKDDPALRSIYRNLWFCYSDVKEHTLTGDHALTDENRAVVRRCLLFLKSDLEFQWLPTTLLDWAAILRVIGLGWIAKRRLERVARLGGDQDVWPFLTKAQYAQFKEVSQL